MRAVIQRVTRASVHVIEGQSAELVSEIGAGVFTLLGVKTGDTEKDADWLIRKILALRIFNDLEGKMNLSLKDVGGSHLIVSQFTLWGDTQKGNRPSFIAAAQAESARALYEHALQVSRIEGVETFGGRFQTQMRVATENDGPVTFILDSPVSGPKS